MFLGRPILGHGDEVQVGKRQVHLHVLINLLVAEAREAIEILERVVDEFEDFLAHASVEDFLLRQGAHVQVVALHDHLRNLHHLLRHQFGHEDFELHVVVVLFPSAETFHVLGIVRVVVDGGHRAELVETEGQHALGVEVGEAQRANHFLHALAAAEVGHGIEQRTAHLDVVDEVNPTEAHALAFPLLVGAVVDDGSHATSQLPVLVGQVVLGFAEFESCVFITAQRRHFVAEKSGCVVGVTLIQIVMELDKCLQVFLRRDLLNFNLWHLFSYFCAKLVIFSDKTTEKFVILSEKC